MREDLRSPFNTRQYMLSKDYEIYYYSDIHMIGTGTHSHDYYEFFFFIDGDITMEILPAQFKLSSGDLVIIPPDVPHQSIIDDPNQYYRRFVLWVSKDFFNELIESDSSYRYVIDKAAEKNYYVHHFEAIAFNAIKSKIFALIHEIHRDRFGRDAMILLNINNLLLDINRSVYEERHPLQIKEKAGVYHNLILYIDNHLTEEMTLDMLANQFYVSKYHISHVFKDNLGISIHQYIIKRRLELFIDMLQRGGDVNSAYLACGFSDYSSFFRSFKKEYGISPSEYKAQLTKDNIDYLLSGTN